MTSDRKLVLVLGDVLALVLALVVMIVIRFRDNAQAELAGTQTRTFLLLFILWLVLFFIFELYNLRRVNPNPRTIGMLALAVAICTLLSGVVFYLFSANGIAPKTNLAIVAGGAFVFLTGWRRIFYKLFASRYRQKILVIGEGEAVEHLLADLSANPHMGVVSGHFVSYDPAAALPAADLIIADNVNLEGLMRLTEATGAQTLSLSGAYEELFAKIPLSLMTEDRAISILTNQHRDAYRLLGRIGECLIALLVLALSAPFMLIAMLAILIEDGKPLIYRQLRTGKNGVPFFMYKLRSMRTNAEEAGAQWAQKKDARITAVGHILRVTHLDEVPQMLNILKGDLALIGPRAERPEFVAELEKQIPYYFLRHAAKPGFTGWAQIKFRYARTIEDSREKFEYDLYYLAHRNPMFDLGIIAKTVQIIFTH